MPAPQAQPFVAMVAGEASGDLLAGLLLDGFQNRWPQLISAGIGGPQMQRHAELVQDAIDAAEFVTELDEWP